MKRILSFALALTLCLALAACGKTAAPSPSSTAIIGGADGPTSIVVSTKLRVGASPAPHAEILEAAKPLLAAKGIELEIVEFDDYVLPNTALAEGDLDANYFQHQPYLDSFNEGNGTDIVSAGAIHYEPLGIYPGKTATLAELAEGAKIAVPNDGSNEARALYLLEAQGIIKVNHDAGYTATVLDITENPKKVQIVELDADKIPSTIQDVDIAVINGNYAIAAGLNETVLVTEDAKGESATTYANIVAVRSGEEGRAEIKTLVEVLKSAEIKSFIEEKYKGSVVALA